MPSMAEKNRVKRIERRGARPKADVRRYPGGAVHNEDRKPAETGEQIMATALAQPHRRPFSDRASALAGHAGGRLRLWGQITPKQLKALDRYGDLIVAHYSRVIGRPLRYPALNLERTDRSDAGDYEDVAAIHSISDEMDKANRSMLDAGYAEYEAAKRALFRVAVMDVDKLPPDELGALRCGLNALVKLWGLDE